MMLSFSTILLRLTVAIVLGAFIGLEREMREHTAGMRINALVALGAALFKIISEYGFLDMLKFQHVSLDPTNSCLQNDVTIENISIQTEQAGVAIELACRAKSASGLTQAIEALHSLSGVKAIEVNIQDANRKDILN